ncbi:HIT domain-containing protein [Kitasatospora sp. NPDC002965]|uniref:HIT family protein n=1 Tax=Kitasatospora sp. NPDC002965 TaxID=3154775 RepID=UPI0033A6BC7F
MTAFDLDAYNEQARNGPCFICSMLAGAPGYEHRVVYDDGVHIAFLDRYPTLPGKVLVAPRTHVEDTVGHFTEDEYLALQRVVHRVATALAATVPTERLYVLSLGSRQGNSHVHWHIAALPPGVPYEQQQFHALMTEGAGVLPHDPERDERLAAVLRSRLRLDHPDRQNHPDHRGA